MEIDLLRDKLSDKRTLGKLSFDGVFFCYTCEDTVRAPGVKIHGQTAIPYGRHKVVANYSPRFKKRMAEIICKGFSGVRFHNGLHEGHTEGCVLTGTNRNAVSIYGKCGDEVNKKILDAIDAGFEIFITIR